MNMNPEQVMAMSYALSAVRKLECNAARIKLFSGLELNSGDCRALLVACHRNAESTQKDVLKLNDWFFDRYDFDNKIKFGPTIYDPLEFC